MGNATSITDPLNNITTQQFDALNRRNSVTDPSPGGTTITTYDAHDRPLTVTDPNGNITSYVYDGFGDVIQVTSPDTDTAVYHYDSDANLTKKVDAARITVTHTYDALDRVLTTTYPADSKENVTYKYDETGHGFGIGRLTSLTDAAGNLSRSYDERGNVGTDVRTHGSVTLTSSYIYDSDDRLASITYPSGAALTYTYDLAGRLSTFPMTAGGKNWTGYALHQPFGPVTSITNYTYPGVEGFSYDLDDRTIEVVTQSSQQLWMGFGYTYDLANNLKTATDYYSSTYNETLGYDTLNRLTSASGGYGSYTYSYDEVGNRQTSVLNGITTDYSYTPATNRLASVGSTTITTNANGSITGFSPGIKPPAGGPAITALSYNNAGRLSTVKAGSSTIATYTYDAFEHRTVKTTGSTGELYVYGPSGELLEETNSAGAAISDYIYADGQLANVWLASLKEMVGVSTDRRAVPQVGIDVYGITAWSAQYQPFGFAYDIVTSDKYTGPVTQNLRLLGQYSDAETGFYQNGARDYMPSWGRYLESDPIGLVGGLNTYRYADANPERFTDRSGLICWKDVTNAVVSIVAFITSMFGQPNNPSNFPEDYGPTTYQESLTERAEQAANDASSEIYQQTTSEGPLPPSPAGAAVEEGAESILGRLIGGAAAAATTILWPSQAY
jgi:RHS repeat-associated protein